MDPRTVSRSQSDSDLTPREAAERLEIPPSTLRTYAVEFTSLLSPGAQTVKEDAQRSYHHRRYTIDDFLILQEAKGLLAAGLSFRLALAELVHSRAGRSDATAPPAVSPSPPDPARPETSRRPVGELDFHTRELIEALARRLERIDRQLDDNRQALAVLIDLVERLRADLADSSQPLVREIRPTPEQRSGILGLFRRASDHRS